MEDALGFAEQGRRALAGHLALPLLRLRALPFKVVRVVALAHAALIQPVTQELIELVLVVYDLIYLYVLVGQSTVEVLLVGQLIAGLCRGEPARLADSREAPVRLSLRRWLLVHQLQRLLRLDVGLRGSES